jgi:hypothetical protein
MNLFFNKTFISHSLILLLSTRVAAVNRRWDSGMWKEKIAWTVHRPTIVELLLSRMKKNSSKRVTMFSFF